MFPEKFLSVHSLLVEIEKQYDASVGDKKRWYLELAVGMYNKSALIETVLSTARASLERSAAAYMESVNRLETLLEKWKKDA